MDPSVLRKVVNVSVSCELIDDYWQASAPSFSDQLTTRVAVMERHVGDRVFSEFVTVDDNDQGLHLYEWDEVSSSGWTSSRIATEFKVPSGSTITDGIASIDAIDDAIGQSVIYNYRYTVSGSPPRASIGVLNRQVDGAWKRGFPGTQQFRFDVPADSATTYRSDDGSVHVCASASLFDSEADSITSITVLSRNAGGDWASRQDIVDGSLSSVPEDLALRPQYRIIAGDDDFVFLRLFDGAAAWRAGSASDWTKIAGLPSLLDASIRDVHVTCTDQGRESFVLRTARGAVFLVSQWRSATPVITPLTGGTDAPSAVHQLAVGSDPRGDGTRVLALESVTNSLWALRTATSLIRLEGERSGVAWVPLGGTFKSIAAPPTMLGFGEIFAASFDDTVIHKRQDAVGKVWRDTTIKIPLQVNSPPINAATYSTEVIVHDARGRGIGGRTLCVSASRHVEAVINGVATHLDPAVDAPHTTDPYGRLTLVTEATDLDTASLTVHVPDLMDVDEAITIDPAHTSRRRAAGEDATFRVDGTTLKNRNLISSALDGPQADAVATAITTVAKLSTTTAVPDGVSILQQWLLPDEPINGLGYSNARGTGFVVPLNPVAAAGLSVSIEFDGPAPTVTLIEATEARELVLAGVGGTDVAGLGGILGDVLHFLRHETAVLEKVVVAVVDDEIHAVLNGVTHTIVAAEHAAALLDVIWAKVRDAAKSVLAAIEEVLAWLKVLFDWETIRNTQQVLGHVLRRGLVHLKASVPVAQHHLENDFDKLVDNINRAISADEQAFAVDIDQTVTRANGNTPLDYSAPATAHRRNGVRSNYAVRSLTTVDPLASDASRRELASSVDPASLIDAFTSSFDVAELTKSFEKIQQWAGKAFEDSSSFFDESIKTILEAVKDSIDVVLDSIEGFVRVVLEIVEDVIDAFTDFVEKPLDIPLFGTLLGQEDITVLDAYTLAMAVPMTVLGDVLAPEVAPLVSNEMAKSILANDIPWPVETSVAQSNSNDGAFDLIPLFNLLSGIGVAGLALADVGADIAASTDFPLPGWLGTTFAFTELIVQIGAIPSTLISTSADISSIVVWGFQFLPTFTDLVSLLFGAAFSDSAKLTRFQAVVGPTLDSVYGLFEIGLATWQAIEIATDGAVAVLTSIDAFTTAIPLSVKGLIPIARAGFNSPQPEVGLVPLLLLVAVDGLTDTVTPGLRITAAAERL